jgi:hypothetical protein
MRNYLLNFQNLKRIFSVLSGFLFFIIAFYYSGCTKPQHGISQYVFTYESKECRIRSIHAEDQNISYNELTGDKFTAADFDQDRILDQIVTVDIALAEAQKIYDYGLSKLSEKNKLKLTTPTARQYYQENTYCDYEIKSFCPINADPFNEFKIIDKKSGTVNISIYFDQKADGTLDYTLKGIALSPDIQSEYSNILATGIQKDKLTKVNNTILVKEE